MNSRKCASYHLVHLLKITPVALRVRVQIPNEAVGSGPSLPVQPLLPAGLPSPLWPSSISILRAFVSAVPSAWSTLPHHFQLANVNQVSAYLSSPKRTLPSPSTSAPSPFHYTSCHSVHGMRFLSLRDCPSVWSFTSVCLFVYCLSSPQGQGPTPLISTMPRAQDQRAL